MPKPRAGSISLDDPEPGKFQHELLLADRSKEDDGLSIVSGALYGYDLAFAELLMLNPHSGHDLPDTLVVQHRPLAFRARIEALPVIVGIHILVGWHSSGP